MKTSRATLRLRVVSTIAALATVLAVSGCATVVKADQPIHVPFLTSGVNNTAGPGGDVHITSAKQLSDRSYELDVTTANVDPGMTVGGNNVIVTLPTHFSLTTKYPTVYLLHGSGGDGDAEQWYNDGKIETLLGDDQVIAISPDGGKAGWYSDWSGPGSGTQKWQSYHLNQLVPWVDSHLPTINAASARAVAGLSMGGYGAMHYAEARPDLFSAVASFSGLLSLKSEQDRAIIADETADLSGSRDNIFGDGWQTTEQQWNDHDPLVNASALKNTRIFLYSGPGSINFDSSNGTDIEKSLRASADEFTQELSRLGLKYNYDSATPPGNGCDGGHNWGCWINAAQRAFPAFLGGLEHAKPST